MEKINNEALISMLEYVLSTIGNYNLAIFLSIDIKFLCEIHIHLGINFSELMVNRFFFNYYIPEAHNLKSLYFLTEFITALLLYIENQTISENYLEKVSVCNNF